jgi:hypothetical protein
MKLLSSFAAISVLTLVAGCSMEARQEDDLLVTAGFKKTKASTPEGASIVKSVLYHHFVHRTVNGVPMVFYTDPIACKCVYSGTEAAYIAYRQAYSEEDAIYDQIDLNPP